MPTFRTVLSAGLGVLSVSSLIACSDLTNQPLPAGTSDPSSYNTSSGARTLRNGAIYELENELPSYITSSGLLTDELESNQSNASVGVLQSSQLGPEGSIDERILPELTSGSGGGTYNADYQELQKVRGAIAQALGTLAAYDSSAESPRLRGELFALNGYTEILLADFFCSGVPLSTVDFQGDFTYHAGSSVTVVYQDAIAQEDSAIVLASGHDSIQSLARVLKGRALLALGQYSEAAQTVSTVADDFQYLLAIQWVPPNLMSNKLSQSATISDREGTNGLPYRTGGDARTATTRIGTSQTGTILYFPARYTATPGQYTQFPVANGIEARLIQAEAALHDGDADTWLGILNHLRETAHVPGQTAALPDTADPGTDTARLSLMFRERAYWLFVSGHRQGDLRRLVRVYHRPQNEVYPTGSYTAPGAGTYGSDINAPVPSGEFTNPLYHGCLDRDE